MNVNGLEITDLADKYRSPGIRWKTYPNPMRDDGLFVAEDGPLGTYEVMGLGGPLYHATSATVHQIPFQLPPDQARELVSLLNS